MAAEKLIIDFWDVGQGDATVVRLPNNELVIIDVGPKGSPMLDWLEERNRSIHAVVITHNDEDHAGCLPSLVKSPNASIKTIYMLLDRDKRLSKFQNIWRPVRTEETNGRFSVIGLFSDTVIWKNGDTSLKVIYPSFGDNIDAGRPNETSAVICLSHKGNVKIVWPGDAPMQVIADKCAGTSPDLLHGPHHGGPVDKKKSTFKNSVESLLPERVFVSVGSSNSYGLPSPDYLKLQSQRGCRITCTQLTKHCDPSRKTPVIQTAVLLGLRAPRTGVSCRGCFRVTVTNGNVVSDPYDAEHAARVAKLRRPKCL